MKTLLFSCRDQEQSFILQPLNDSNTTGGTRDGKSSLSIKVRRAPSLCCQSFTRAPAIITEKVHPGGHVPINLTTLQHFYQPWLFPTGRKKSHHEAHGRFKKKKLSGEMWENKLNRSKWWKMSRSLRSLGHGDPMRKIHLTCPLGSVYSSSKMKSAFTRMVALFFFKVSQVSRLLLLRENQMKSQK